IILLIIKLFLARYSIEFRVLSNSLLGAVIAAKTSLILDRWNWGCGGGRPRILNVALRTALYCCGVIYLGIMERLIHGFRTTGSLAGGARLIAANFDPDRFFAIVLLVSLVFAIYFAMREINDSMGDGALYALFFKRPVRIAAPEPRAAAR
ncbi:MAG: hypothetical protein ACREP6_08970, partial [Candidatus Binataceae bacterium]